MDHIDKIALAIIRAMFEALFNATIEGSAGQYKLNSAKQEGIHWK